MMNVKRSLRYLILFLFLLGIFVPALPSVTAKAEIRLNQSTKSIYVGKYGKLRIVDTETAAGDSYTVTWSSSDRDIVKVSQKGTIKGIAAGTATVTATLKHVPPSDPDVTSDSWHTMVLTCTVTVKPRFYTKDTYTTKTLNVSGDTWTWIPFYFLGAANEKDLDLFCQISDESMIPGGSGTYVSWKWGDWYGKYKNCRRLYLKGKAEGEIRVNVRNSVTNEVINLKATVHAPEEKVTSEKVSFNTNWTYAGNSKIHSGTSTLYHAAPASSKGITVCINAGHGTSGGTSYQTLCHPDGSPKIVSGSTSAGSTYATAIAVGRTFSNGTPERDATLSLALLLKDRLLNAGYDVLMIRETDDVQLDNIARTLMAKRSGIVRKIVDTNEKNDTLLELSFNIGPGDAVRPYTNGRDRIGQVILSGSTLAECERILHRVESNIDIILTRDLPVPETPIHFAVKAEGGQNIYVKREDMIPFSFGGNKVRFSAGYLADMEERGCDAMIIYGGYNSNLCRILSDACRMRGLPCSMIHNIDDAEEDENTPNARMIRAAGVREYPCHKGPAIADAVEQAMADFVQEGRKPYYINGDKTGHGNVHVPMRAYDAAYDEIVRYEEASGVHFSKIYLAASTCTTQSGLIAGSIRHGDDREIIGISVTRNKQRASEVILENLLEYFEKTGASAPSKDELAARIRVRDQYLAGGYALYDEEIERVIRETYLGAGIPLDPVYTGKAFRGMLADLDSASREDENILFLHTGGAPLFFEYLEKQGFEE